MPKYRVQFYGPTYFVIANSEEEAQDLVERYVEEIDMNEVAYCMTEEDNTVPDDLCIRASEE